jgi:hypothetical protein
MKLPAKQAAARAKGARLESVEQHGSCDDQAWLATSRLRSPFRKVALSLATELYFRVRAFFYAESSKLVSVTTPADPLPVRAERGRKP